MKYKNLKISNRFHAKIAANSILAIFSKNFLFQQRNANDLLIISIVLIMAVLGQKTKTKVKAPKMSAAQKATEDKVKKIKKTFFDINAAKLESKTFNYTNRCGVRKAAVTLYYKGSDIVKITDLGTGDGDKSAASWSYQYYYDKGKLIFAYEQTTHDPKARTIENRRYYLGNKLVRKIEDGKVTDNPKETIANTATEYQLRTIKTEADIAKVYKCG